MNNIRHRASGRMKLQPRDFQSATPGDQLEERQTLMRAQCAIVATICPITSFPRRLKACAR